jgi:LacI family gluconate utilization system Gnt-I transcriptional repressor
MDATISQKRKIRMVDVAKAAGVSPMTVSRVLKADSTVSDARRKSVLKVIDELGYVPDSLAGALSSSRSGFVAVMLRKISNYNPSSAIAVLDQILESNGLQMIIGNAGYLVEKEEALVEGMLRRRPEAFVLTGGIHTDRARRLLRGAGIPVVEAFELPADPIDHVVGFSNEVAMKRLVHRLHERGYRRMALLGGADEQSARSSQRSRGYMDAVRELGLGRGIVLTVKEPLTMREGGEAIVRLVEEFPEVEVALCVSDLLAFGAVMECQRRGWDVPGKIAIAGFGNSELAAECHPGITTVGSDSRKIGQDIGRVLLDALEGVRNNSPISSVTLGVDYRVVERLSTQRSER